MSKALEIRQFRRFQGLFPFAVLSGIPAGDCVCRGGFTPPFNNCTFQRLKSYRGEVQAIVE